MRYLLAALMGLFSFGLAGSAEYCRAIAVTIDYKGQSVHVIEHGTYEYGRDSIDLILEGAKRFNGGVYVGMTRLKGGDYLFTLQAPHPLGVVFSNKHMYYCYLAIGPQNEWTSAPAWFG